MLRTGPGIVGVSGSSATTLSVSDRNRPPRRHPGRHTRRARPVRPRYRRPSAPRRWELAKLLTLGSARIHHAERPCRVVGVPDPASSVDDEAPRARSGIGPHEFFGARAAGARIDTPQAVGAEQGNPSRAIRRRGNAIWPALGRRKVEYLRRLAHGIEAPVLRGAAREPHGTLLPDRRVGVRHGKGKIPSGPRHGIDDAHHVGDPPRVIHDAIDHDQTMRFDAGRRRRPSAKLEGFRIELPDAMPARIGVINEARRRIDGGIVRERPPSPQFCKAGISNSSTRSCSGGVSAEPSTFAGDSPSIFTAAGRMSAGGASLASRTLSSSEQAGHATTRVSAIELFMAS
jgi:hypothetical protein